MCIICSCGNYDLLTSFVRKKGAIFFTHLICIYLCMSLYFYVLNVFMSVCPIFWNKIETEKKFLCRLQVALTTVQPLLSYLQTFKLYTYELPCKITGLNLAPIQLSECITISDTKPQSFQMGTTILRISAGTEGGPRSRVCARYTLRSSPINTSGNFPAHMSAESSSNISPNPSEVISEVSEP